MPHLAHPRSRSLPADPRRAAAPARSLLDAEAVAVLHRAARVLLDDLTGLTDRLVAELARQEAAYRTALEADAAGVRQEVRRSLEHNVGSLLHPGRSRAAARHCSWGIGTARAAQGFPLDALQHAFRLGGALVWQGLVDATAHRRPDEVRLLVHAAADVWHFVDEHCTLVADAYRTEERRPGRCRADRLRRMTAALLDGATRIAELPEVARALGLPEQGRYAVIRVADGRRAAASPAPEAGGPRILWHVEGDAQFGIALLGGGRDEAGGCDEAGGRDKDRGHADGAGEAGLAALARGLSAPAGTRIGISPAVDGLPAVGDARRLAETALRTCPATGGTALLDAHLPAALLVSSPALGQALAARVLGPLLRLEPADRDLLLRTLTTWLECDGSAQRAGARLYCHRNTVLNRLRRCEQLTGRSLHRPADLVELSLALTARHLLPH